MNAADHAELSVLSSILLEPRLCDDVSAKLAETDFTGIRPAIFKALLQCRDEGVIDLANLRAKCPPSVQDDRLAELVDYTATVANLEHHVEAVLAESQKRALVTASNETLRECAEDTYSAEELLDRAETRILDVGKARDRKNAGPVHVREIVGPALDLIEKASQRGQDGALLGIPSGVHDLDKMTGGFLPGQLIMIAARPAMGKSSLGMNIAEFAAETRGKTTVFFSLEMTKEELIQRMIASRAGVNSRNIRLGYLSVQDHAKMLAAAGELEKLPIHIDDQGGVRLAEIKARARRQVAKTGLDMLMVDYIQLVKPDKGSRDRRDLELGEISAGLKNLAKELSIPVIALAQLNRGPEQRDPDKRRPLMADLRDSGNLEQDADVIAFIYRDIVYNPKAEPGKAEIIVAKQRNGPTGTVECEFNASLARFAQQGKKVQTIETEGW